MLQAPSLSYLLFFTVITLNSMPLDVPERVKQTALSFFSPACSAASQGVGTADLACVSLAVVRLCCDLRASLAPYVGIAAARQTVLRCSLSGGAAMWFRIDRELCRSTVLKDVRLARGAGWQSSRPTAQARGPLCPDISRGRHPATLRLLRAREKGLVAGTSKR